jgi:Domain of unknown function (DUF4124)
MRSSMLSAALGLAMLAGSGAIANDQIYKCIDPNGATMLSDRPCAVVESVPADTAPAAVPAADEQPVPVETYRPQVVKEHFKLPAAEIDQGLRPKVQLVSAPPKIDVATLKAAKLRLELEDKTALRQASLD